MKRGNWQFSLFFFVLSSLCILIVNAASTTNDKQSVNHINESTTKGHITHTKHSSTSLPARATKTIRNCSLAAVQRKNALHTGLSHKLSNTQTVYVCHKTKKHTTSTKYHKHGSKKDKSKKTTKKTTKKSHHTKNKSAFTTKKRTTTRTTTTKIHTTTTTRIHTPVQTIKPKAIATTTKTHQSGETTTSPIVVAALQTNQPALQTSQPALQTNQPVSNNNNENTNDNQSTSTPNDNNTTTDDTNDDSASVQVSVAPEDPTNSPTPSVGNAPTDNNNQVSVQSIENGAAIDSNPQSTVIGVSIGAVVGCLAAAGLAGMFIHRRKQKSAHEQDVADMEQNSEVNTRWRTQSFMAVVAGAVAKLPNRSNSSSSTRSIGVLGTIRRAASNASRSLSRSSSRSSAQSHGMAVSGPPPIARIDGDQAQYYGEPASPTSGSGHHHTHAY